MIKERINQTISVLTPANQDVQYLDLVNISPDGTGLPIGYDPLDSNLGGQEVFEGQIWDKKEFTPPMMIDGEEVPDVSENVGKVDQVWNNIADYSPKFEETNPFLDLCGEDPSEIPKGKFL